MKKLIKWFSDWHWSFVIVRMTYHEPPPWAIDPPLVYDGEALFHYDEAYVSPCTLNPHNVGGFPDGQTWSPRIALVELELELELDERIPE